jgi:Mn2+/Fe2+ NRAMP family transporter
LINFANIDPIRALVYSVIINGVIASPILIAFMKIANDKTSLKDKTNGKLSNIIGWVVIVIIGMSVAIVFISLAVGRMGLGRQ